MGRPVEDLRRLGTALRAAVGKCLEKPEAKAVHRLRTTSRRMEAGLQMLRLIPDVPKARRIGMAAKRYLKEMEPVRRAAGKVRDLDVHGVNLAKVLGDAALTREKEALRASLESRRVRSARNLQRVIGRRKAKLLGATAALKKALVPARKVEISPDQAGEIAQKWFGRFTELLDPAQPAELHEIRKAAKLARYMTEQPASRECAVAKRFDRMQAVTGGWHDWFALAKVARKELGAKSKLVARLEQRRDRAHGTAVRLAVGMAIGMGGGRSASSVLRQ